LIIEIVPILNLQLKKVSWYTARLIKDSYESGQVVSEFRDFQQRMSIKEKDKRELNEIREFIHKIGNKYGARLAHFKHERGAEALPPQYHFVETDSPDDYGLRLYCIRLSDEVVILLNGGRKTNRNPESCDNCRAHFRLANNLAKKLNEAILDNYIEIIGREILIDEDFEIEI
jgi:hypothetical protein